MTQLESLQAIRRRYATAQGLRRHDRLPEYAARLDRERAELVEELGMSAQAVSRCTGVPVEELRR